MKKAYLKQLVKVKFPEQKKKLPHSSRGIPLKLGEYDDIVKEYVHHLRLAGGIINCFIVIAAARGILSQLAPARLKEHGGDIEIFRFGKCIRAKIFTGQHVLQNGIAKYFTRQYNMLYSSHS